MSFPTVIAWITRILVGGLFLLAGVLKIMNPLQFAQEIQAYRMVPNEITHAMAFIIPWIEVLAAALLILGVWRGEARVLILVMLVVFTAAKLWTEYKGLRISCGCFGDFAWMEKFLSGVNGIVLNLFLSALLIADFVYARKADEARISVERITDRPAVPAEPSA